MCRIWKNVPHLQKCAALAKMSHTGKNEPRSKNYATFGKMCCNGKNVPHLEKCGALNKMRRT